MTVIQYPITTEKAVGLIERDNKILFSVAKTATKAQVKKEVEERFAVKVHSVHTLTTPKGDKRAYVRLATGFKAEDVASKLKIV